ncbi:ferredoxin-NADP reductase [Bradyrhizobium sp. LB1.3]
MSAAAPRFHRLAVNDLRREASDAVSLTFAIPTELATDYAFTPGQYLTLRTILDGEEVRRSYSICSGPDDGEIRIAVKKVDGGAFSSWAADDLKCGDELDVMTPTGRFGVVPPAGARPHPCRLCRRLRHHADPVDRQGHACARAGQPFLPVLRQSRDRQHHVPRGA